MRVSKVLPFGGETPSVTRVSSLNPCDDHLKSPASFLLGGFLVGRVKPSLRLSPSLDLRDYELTRLTRNGELSVIVSRLL